MMTFNTINWDQPSPFYLSVIVTTQHIDGINHTNNAVYAQWCEDAAWKHSEKLGLSLDDYKRLNRAMAIAKAEYSYLAPSVTNDELVIGTWLLLGNNKLSLERYFQVCRMTDGNTILRGHWQMLCINIQTGSPTRMPAEFISAYIS